MASSFRSTGCHACRRMKVKCDEEKPQCQRCQKGGRQCPGYRLPGDVVFRSMNKNAERKSRRQNQKSRKLGLASSFKTCDSDQQSEEGQSATELQLNSVESYKYSSPPQWLCPDWTEQAKCAFFYDYVVPGLRDERGGYLDFLPDLYREKAGTAYFDAALDAVAVVSFANRTCMSHLIQRARTSYGRALSLINLALSNENEAKSDQLLTSLFLLAKYENISGDKNTLFESHGTGQLELLRLRGREQFTTSRGRNLYRLIHARQRLQDLNHCRDPRNPLNEMLEDVHAGPHAAKLAEILAHVTKLQSAVSRVSHEKDQYNDLAFSTLDLDEQMRLWYDTCPKFIYYRSVPPPGWLAEVDSDVLKIFPKGMYIFINIQIATGWNLFWCGKIYLLQSMLKLRNFMTVREYEQLPLPSEQDIQRRLRDAVDSICATVPYMLEEIDEQGAFNTHRRPRAIGGYFLLWSLYVAGTVTCLPSAQVSWISDRMLQIGHGFGIKQALLMRDFQQHKRAGYSKEIMTALWQNA